MLERDVKKPVVDYAKRLGVGHIRMHMGFGVRAGWPDDWFLIEGGRPLIIEFKATGKGPTKLQEDKIDILEKAGYDVFVCDDIEHGKALIDWAIRVARSKYGAR